MKKVLFVLVSLASGSFCLQAGVVSAGMVNNDKVETTVRQCGNTPDGNFDCTETVYDDGADCLIIDNQGAPGGLYSSGPDC